MRPFLIWLLLLGLSSCKGYFFLAGSSDTGAVSVSFRNLASTQPIVGVLAANLSAELEESGVDKETIATLVNAGTLAAQTSLTALDASQDFMGAAVGALSVTNEFSTPPTLALADDGVEKVLSLTALILNSSYRTTGRYLAQNGNTGATDAQGKADSRVTTESIDNALQTMAGDTLKKLQAIIPENKLKDAVKTVMGTTANSANDMHNKTAMSVQESKTSFEKVMNGIFAEAKNIKGLDIEDVADSVVSSLAIIVGEKHFESKDASTLVIGMSKAIITTVSSDSSTTDKSSAISLKVLEVGMKSLNTAGVSIANLTAEIGNLIEQVSGVALSVAKDTIKIVEQIAHKTQVSVAAVAAATGLEVQGLSKAASAATEKAAFANTSGASASDKAKLTAALDTGGADGMREANITNSPATLAPTSSIPAATTANLTNKAPTISDISAKNTDRNTPVTIGFSISSDPPTVACNSSYLSMSTSTTVVASGAVVFGGTYPNCTAAITPNHLTFGTATITITLNDGTASVSDSFVLTSLDAPPTITSIANITTHEDTPTAAIPFTIGDPDDTVGCSGTYIFMQSSNPAVVRSDVVWGGTSPNCTAIITPLPNAAGSTNITISVGAAPSLQAAATFALIVTPVNDAPTITNITDITTTEDIATTAIAFTITDAETAMACNATYLSMSSSNTTIVENGAVVWGGTYPICTAVITPTADKFGSPTITITVSDGAVSATDSFVLTVTAVNDAPTISDITNRGTNQNTATAISFTVGDAETAMACNVNYLSMSSSMTGVVANASVAWDGTYPNCTVIITPVPNATGTPTITITVNDGAVTAADTFVLTVAAVNDAPTITDITNKNTNEDTATTAIAFTIADTESTMACTSTYLSMSSSSPATVANANVVWAGTFPNCTAVITPVANAFGTPTITITVSDGTASAVDTFDLTVTAVNDTPTITDITNRSTNEDTSTAITFTIADVETTMACSTANLSMSSSNTAVLANSAIVWNGTYPNCTAVIAPVVNAFGTPTITITVSDGTASSSDTFVLTVTAVNDSPTISNITAKSTNKNTATAAINFTIGDVDTTLVCSTANLSMSSSNTAVVANSAVAWSGAFPNCTAIITPVSNAFGTPLITITVSDGIAQASTAFTLQVKHTIAIVKSGVTANATASPSRKTFYDTDNLLHWAFYFNGSGIRFAYSPTNATWTEPTLQLPAEITPNFHVSYKSPYVFLVIENGYDIILRRGTISSNSITFENAVTVLDGVGPNDLYTLPSATVTGAGKIAIAAFRKINNAFFKATVVVSTSDYNVASFISGGIQGVGLVAEQISGLSLLAKDAGGAGLVILINSGGSLSSYLFNGTTWTEMPGLVKEWGYVSNGTVHAIAAAGTNLYIAGTFSSAGDVAASNIAKWNGTSWSALGSGISGSVVKALAVDGTDVYVAGQFSSAGSVANTSNIAKWNGTSWSALGTGISSSQVNALAVAGAGTVYVGGSFSSAGGTALTANIAKWNGSSWVALGGGAAGPTGPVNALVFDGTYLCVGGSFNDLVASIANTNYLAKWDGLLWSPLGTGVNSNVNALAISGTNIYAGGDFSIAGGVSAAKIAKWSGSSWSQVGSGAPTAVTSIAVSGSDVYAASSASTSANKIIKLSGSTWADFGGAVGYPVNVLAVSGTDLYAGTGSFLAKQMTVIAKATSFSSVLIPSRSKVYLLYRDTADSTPRFTSWTSSWAAPVAIGAVGSATDGLSLSVYPDDDLMAAWTTASGLLYYAICDQNGLIWAPAMTLSDCPSQCFKPTSEELFSTDVSSIIAVKNESGYNAVSLALP